MSQYDPIGSRASSEESAVGLSPATKIENVLLIYNPISGRGTSRSMADQVATELERDRIQVSLTESKPIYDPVTMQAQLLKCDLVLVVGGDGTLAGLLPHLSATRTPVYMIAAGNESLFARALEMRPDYDSVAAAIRAGKVEEHFFGTVNERPFFTMATVGLDSRVVDTISKYRKGPIGHIGYVLPTVQQMLSYTPPSLSIEVNGQQVLSDRPGYLIIANSPQYALGLNLVPEANTQNRDLCARFFPGGDVARLLVLATGRLCGMSSALEGSQFFRGNSFKVNCSNAAGYPIQADGEAMGYLPAYISVATESVMALRGLPAV